MNDVKIKDRDNSIEYMRMALNMVGIGVDYKTTVLVKMALDCLKKKKGKMSLKDACEIESAWQSLNDEYREKLKNEEKEAKQ